MKLARQYFVSISQSERVRFIARDMSFHGTTIGALSLTARHGVRSPFEPLLVSDTISFVSSPNTYRGMLSDENSKDYVKRLADELDGEFKRVGPGTVCAFVAETVSGSVSASFVLRSVADTDHGMRSHSAACSHLQDTLQP